jgi:hypothetical protein
MMTASYSPALRATRSSRRCGPYLPDGTDAQVMAVRRNVVIDFCSLVDKPSLAAATRHFLCHPEKAAQLLSIAN